MFASQSNRLAIFVDRVPGWKLAANAVILTLGFAGLYFAMSSIRPSDGLVLPEPPSNAATSDELAHTESRSKVTAQDALYFSIVTEATLGYGDIRPVGFSRLLACTQVLLGLVLAGLIVAKITSAHGSELRVAAYQAGGNWIEPCRMPDATIMVSFTTIFLSGDILRYDGENFDVNATPIGFYRGELIDCEGALLRFRYSNRESSTTYFVEGICSLAFSGKPGSQVWTRYHGTAHDLGTGQHVPYEGFRASADEIAVFNSTAMQERRGLIQKYVEACKNKQPDGG